MRRTILAATFTLGVSGAGYAETTPINASPTAANCRAARAIVEDRQRTAIGGDFHFVDGENMVCFRPPQTGQLNLKPAFDATEAVSQVNRARSTPAPLPRPNLVTRRPLPPPPSPWLPGPNVAGDGLPVRGSLAFKTGHTLPLTQTRDLGTRIGGNLTQDRVSFNSVEVRLAQRF